MASELSTGNEGDGGEKFHRLRMDGKEPITDHNSKMVMLAAERHDQIEIPDVVTQFSDAEPIPDAVSVLERTATYYGPELLVHARRDGRDQNFLLSAPGPESYLHLWGAETDTQDRRTAWYTLAEVQAVLADEQPAYEICSDCGNPMRSIDHERKARFGMCSE